MKPGKPFPLKLNEDLSKEIREIAEQESMSITSTMQSLLKLAVFFHKEIRSGKKVKLVSEDGCEQLYEIIF